MRHDPERNAAAYLGGLLSGRKRRQFESHIVECEDCWHEVDAGRKGRAVAESGRELAPQVLRERVRAAVESVTPRPKRRWAFGAVALAAAVGAGSLYWMNLPDQPEPIEAVLATFADERSVGYRIEPTLPNRLGDLTLAHARAGQFDGLSTRSHYYVDRAGHDVVVHEAESEWPVALGAEHDSESHTWEATADDLTLFCASDPAPFLIVGDDAGAVHLAAAALGLR
ncbi:MAG: zf-HC2 domain-containing protein [Actinomycetota bacterium]|nr:zf-HC2 domain-containing protein [Actinomycetota bacterium]